jgi:DNA-binding NarL/FixJ family response regulator
MAIKVMLVDQDAIFTDCLRAVLAMERAIKVVAATGDGATAIRIAARTRPDVLITEIPLNGIDGLETIQQLRRRLPALKAIVLTANIVRENVHRALSIGVDGILLKQSTHMPTLLEAIFAVAEGGRAVSPAISAMIINDSFDKTIQSRSMAALTLREQQVLRLIVGGNTSAQAGKALSLSPKTVETYRSRLGQKLGIKSLPDLVRFAILHGMTPLEK